MKEIFEFCALCKGKLSLVLIFEKLIFPRQQPVNAVLTTDHYFPLIIVHLSLIQASKAFRVVVFQSAAARLAERERDALYKYAGKAL